MGIWYQFGVYMREQKAPEVEGDCEWVTQKEMDKIIDEWVDDKLRGRGIAPEKLLGQAMGYNPELLNNVTIK